MLTDRCKNQIIQVQLHFTWIWFPNYLWNWYWSFHTRNQLIIVSLNLYMIVFFYFLFWSGLCPRIPMKVKVDDAVMCQYIKPLAVTTPCSGRLTLMYGVVDHWNQSSYYQSTTESNNDHRKLINVFIGQFTSETL